MCSRSLLQLQVAASMVAVVVCVEDMGQPPTAPIQRRHHWIRHGRVHHACRAGLGIMEEINVIVVQHQDLFDLKAGHRGLLA